MVLNMKVAHDFLLNEFGVTTDIGWQLDTFGHSAGGAKLYAEMDYRALVLGRINWRQKDQMRSDKDIEFIWNPILENASG